MIVLAPFQFYSNLMVGGSLCENNAEKFTDNVKITAVNISCNKITYFPHWTGWQKTVFFKVFIQVISVTHIRLLAPVSNNLSQLEYSASQSLPWILRLQNDTQKPIYSEAIEQLEKFHDAYREQFHRLYFFPYLLLLIP